jgi:glycerate-2-kinase
VPRYLPSAPAGRTIVVGAGKASAATMIAAYRAGARFAPFADRARKRWS